MDQTKSSLVLWRRVATVGSLVSLLQGCIMVPGSNIDVDEPSYASNSVGFFSGSDRGGNWFPGIGDGESAIPEGEVTNVVDIVPITPQLVADQQRASEGRIAAAIPAALEQQLANYEYYVGKGDMLQVIVYDHPELTNPSGSNNNNVENSGITVENDGTIYYPYIGKVNVEGMAVEQIRDAIAGPLANYITDPQISVRVLQFNSKRAFVTGMVNEPGPQPITNVPMTVLEAISRAGGLAEGSNWHEVLLSRNGEETRLSVYEMLNNGRLGQNMLVQDGDVLHVPEFGQQQVFVLGELNRVSALPVGNMRLSLTEALTRSGGLNQVTSNAEGVFVIRQLPEGNQKLATVYQLNVRNALNFAVGTRFMLEPTDIVYVTTAPVTRWNRVISQLMPSLNAILTVDRVGGI